MPSIRDKQKTLSVEGNVLHALLHIPKYKYGTRSMIAIIEMSAPVYGHTRRFTKSMIPPPAQLELHVDAAEFYRLMDEYDEKEKKKKEEEKAKTTKS